MPEIIFWKSKNEGTVQIKDMTTSHIENCIRKIEKYPHWRRQYLRPLKLELRNRRNLSIKKHISEWL